MKMRTAMLLLAVAILLAGCTAIPSREDIRGHMVTEITVTGDIGDTSTQRYYNHPDKIRMILLTIRRLGPDFPALVDVEAVEGKTLCMQMVCMDGRQIVYRIKGNLYLQKDGGAWRQVNREAVWDFSELLLQIPVDEESSGI